MLSTLTLNRPACLEVVWGDGQYRIARPEHARIVNSAMVVDQYISCYTLGASNDLRWIGSRMRRCDPTVFMGSSFGPSLVRCNVRVTVSVPPSRSRPLHLNPKQLPAPQATPQRELEQPLPPVALDRGEEPAGLLSGERLEQPADPVEAVSTPRP